MVKRLAALAVALVMAVSVLCGCTERPPEMIERTSFLFDTIVTIKLRSCEDAEIVLSEAFDLCQQYHRLFDRFDPESDISRINSSGGAPCEVSEETVRLIRAGLEYSELSEGRFDITCGRVTELWDFSAENPSLPSPDELTAALQTIGWEAVSVDGNVITVPEGTELDLGGIAKGYIADRIAEFLVEKGIDSAIVNLGGNVRVLGTRNGQPFRVGIQSPFHEGSTIGQVNVTDCSVVTAGSYQRCFELDGTVYHHILDLSDGMPAASGLASVTVICESSARADALATICFLMGAEDAIDFIESMDAVEAIMIKDTGELRLTSGAMAIFAMND